MNGLMSSNDIDEAAMHEAATLDEYLVPIRLDIDLEGHRLRDTLTWNKNGKEGYRGVIVKLGYYLQYQGVIVKLGYYLITFRK